MRILISSAQLSVWRAIKVQNLSVSHGESPHKNINKVNINVIQMRHYCINMWIRVCIAYIYLCSAALCFWKKSGEDRNRVSGATGNLHGYVPGWKILSFQKQSLFTHCSSLFALLLSILKPVAHWEMKLKYNCFVSADHRQHCFYFSFILDVRTFWNKTETNTETAWNSFRFVSLAYLSSVTYCDATYMSMFQHSLECFIIYES